MSTYTHRVLTGPFEVAPVLIIECDGVEIFRWPAATIPASTHDALCYKIGELHKLTSISAAEKARKAIRDALGVDQAGTYLSSASYGR